MALSEEFLLLAAAALLLALLVYLMYRSALAREWGALSRREKGEMKKRAEAKK